MLELRPSCEHCNKLLPPNSTEAMICSYECTFCHDCVDSILNNVCPNCGGGFCLRPIRPKNNLRNNNYFSENPSSDEIIFKPVNIEQHEEFSCCIKNIQPEKR